MVHRLTKGGLFSYIMIICSFVLVTGCPAYFLAVVAFGVNVRRIWCRATC